MRSLLEARAVIQKMAESDPAFELRGPRQGSVIGHVCALCSSLSFGKSGELIEHKPACPYRLAREWMEGDDRGDNERGSGATP